MEQKLRLIELTDRKRVGFLTLFINLAAHVALFCIQGAILYSLHMDDAHPRIMLQIGVILFLLFLAAGLGFKLKEWFGWNKTIRELEAYLYDPPAEPKDDKPCVLSVLLTRNHGPVSNLIYWCTGRQFTHAALGLGEQTEVFYSFGFHGFREEHPGHRKIHSRHKESLCYQFRITEEEYQQVQRNIEVYQKQAAATRYNLLGAILSPLKIYRPLKPERTYFCSEFVSEQLRSLPSFHLKMRPNMYLPTYLAKALIQQDNLLNVKVNEV